MSLDQQQLISAEVVLQSASGKAIDGQAIITSETIKDYAPSPETAARVRAAFTTAGFEVGPTVGISFAITAPVNIFEKMFKTRLRQEERGGIEAIKDDDSGSYELPLDALPVSIANLIVAVTFTPPPDFGPTDFFGS